MAPIAHAPLLTDESCASVKNPVMRFFSLLMYACFGLSAASLTAERRKITSTRAVLSMASFLSSSNDGLVDRKSKAPIGK